MRVDYVAATTPRVQTALAHLMETQNWIGVAFVLAAVIDARATAWECGAAKHCWMVVEYATATIAAVLTAQAFQTVGHRSTGVATVIYHVQRAHEIAMVYGVEPRKEIAVEFVWATTAAVPIAVVSLSELRSWIAVEIVLSQKTPACETALGLGAEMRLQTHAGFATAMILLALTVQASCMVTT